MRAYFFTNFYLNTISQGIQPAHCLVDMLMFYHQVKPNSIETGILDEWANNHKTMICLNGGMLADIEETYAKLTVFSAALKLPFGCFHEEQAALGGQMTTCGIIVPEYIYALAADRAVDLDELIQLDDGQYLKEEIELAALLRSCRLAQ